MGAASIIASVMSVRNGAFSARRDWLLLAAIGRKAPIATGRFWSIVCIRIRYGIATPNAFSVCVSIFPLTGSPESI